MHNSAVAVLEKDQDDLICPFNGHEIGVKGMKEHGNVIVVNPNA